MANRSHAFTLQGRRRAHNEDALLADDTLGLYAVADGVSLGAAGEVAAQMAVATLHEAFEEWFECVDELERIGELAHDGLLYAANLASSTVYESGLGGPNRGMAASLTAAFFPPLGRSRVIVASVGDTRAVLLRGGVVRVLTRVDTLADEFVRANFIQPAQAVGHPYARTLTRAIGVQPTTLFDILAVDLEPGDVILLMTNGVNVSEEQLRELDTRTADVTAETIARQLLSAVGDDDATAIVIQHNQVERPSVAPVRPHLARSSSGSSRVAV